MCFMLGICFPLAGKMGREGKWEFCLQHPPGLQRGRGSSACVPGRGGLAESGDGRSQHVGAARFEAWEEKGALVQVPPASASKPFHFAGTINTKKCSSGPGWDPHLRPGECPHTHFHLKPPTAEGTAQPSVSFSLLGSWWQSCQSPKHVSMLQPAFEAPQSSLEDSEELESEAG